MKRSILYFFLQAALRLVPLLHAADKRTGKELGTVEIPAPTNTAPMTFMHEGRQYIVLSVASPDVPAEHVALAE